jgi:hypothetical protein
MSAADIPRIREAFTSHWLKPCPPIRYPAPIHYPADLVSAQNFSILCDCGSQGACNGRPTWPDVYLWQSYLTVQSLNLGCGSVATSNKLRLTLVLFMCYHTLPKWRDSSRHRLQPSICSVHAIRSLRHQLIPTFTDPLRVQPECGILQQFLPSKYAYHTAPESLIKC